MIAPRRPFDRRDTSLVPTLPRGNAAAWDARSNGPRDDVPTLPRGNEAERDGVSPRCRFWLRVLFALDIVGAGGPGVLMLAAPDKAADLLFAGDLAADAGTQVLGCIWVALGLLSIAGLLRPLTFSPVLLVQFAYKLIWLLAIGLPAAATGDRVSPVLTAIFAGWVAAVGFAAPWRVLFGTKVGTFEAPPRKPR